MNLVFSCHDSILMSLSARFDQYVNFAFATMKNIHGYNHIWRTKDTIEQAEANYITKDRGEYILLLVRGRRHGVILIGHFYSPKSNKIGYNYLSSQEENSC